MKLSKHMEEDLQYEKEIVSDHATLAMAGSLMACAGKEELLLASEAKTEAQTDAKAEDAKAEDTKAETRSSKGRGCIRRKRPWLAWQCQQLTCRDGTRTEAI